MVGAGCQRLRMSWEVVGVEVVVEVEVVEVEVVVVEVVEVEIIVEVVVDVVANIKKLTNFQPKQKLFLR